ncbi:NYN domain-containing protein [bacterium]|nr:NYN domain-containing protein [bacterium]
MKRICIFVDGENFRFSILDLFPDFNKWEYLPKEARWQAFFDWLSYEVIKGVISEVNYERLRTYWYVINDVYSVPFLTDPRENEEEFIRVVKREIEIDNEIAQKKELLKTPDDNFVHKNELVIKFKRLFRGLVEDSAGYKSLMYEFLFKWYLQNKRNRQYNSKKWRSIQNEIAKSNRSVEFRRAGVLKHNMITNKLLGEKGVDVKLAIDLIELKDIYDVAVILSGDQDYIPAVRKIKDYGKWVVNIAFEKPDGGLLPGGAVRLNQVTDWSFAVPYSSLRSYLFGDATELGGFEPVD